MTAKAAIDYVSSLAADYTAAELNLRPHEVIEEDGSKNQVVHEGDDGSEEVVTRSNVSVFYLTLGWKEVTASEAGDLIDMYHNTDKANGIAKSFYITVYDDTSTNTYTVKFAERTTISRDIAKVYRHSLSLTFKVKGYKPA